MVKPKKFDDKQSSLSVFSETPKEERKIDRKPIFETEEKVEPKIPSRIRHMKPHKDCKYRQGYECIKKKKRVALDVRDEVIISCWERMYCDDFEVKEEVE